MLIKTYKLRLLALCVVGLFGHAGPLYAQDGDGVCLNGYELTAIVLLEMDIRHAVSAYECQMVDDRNAEIYALYQQMHDKWQPLRDQQARLRDKVYRRIYGKDWRVKVNEWTSGIASRQGKAFVPVDGACQALKAELLKRVDDWKYQFDSAAREAAAPQFDEMRCENL